MKMHADAVQKVEQRLSTFSEKRLRACAASVQPVIGEYVDGTRTCTVADDVKKSSGVRNVCFWRQGRAGCRCAHRVSRSNFISGFATTNPGTRFRSGCVSTRCFSK